MTEVIDPIEYSERLEESRATPKRPRKWKDVVLCSYAAMEAMAAGGSLGYVVFDGEGTFDDKGRFTFNEEHHDFEPLLIDIGTARLMAQLPTLVSEESKGKIATAYNQRYKFVKLAEVCWKHASF